MFLRAQHSLAAILRPVLEVGQSNGQRLEVPRQSPRINQSRLGQAWNHGNSQLGRRHRSNYIDNHQTRLSRTKIELLTKICAKQSQPACLSVSSRRKNPSNSSYGRNQFTDADETNQMQPSSSDHSSVSAFHSLRPLFTFFQIHRSRRVALWKVKSLHIWKSITLKVTLYLATTASLQ